MLKKYNLDSVRVVESAPLNCRTAIDLCMFSGIRLFEKSQKSLAVLWSCHISILKRYSASEFKQSLAFFSVSPRALRMMNQGNALFWAK